MKTTKLSAAVAASGTQRRRSLRHSTPENAEGKPTKMRLTKVYVLSLPRDGSGDRRHWDSELPGLYLECSPKGVLSFRLRYSRADGRKNDITIGRASVLSPDQARDAARAMLAELTLHGVDPSDTKANRKKEATAQLEGTFKALADKFAIHDPGDNDRKQSDEVYALQRYILPRIGHLPFDGITRHDVREMVKAVQQDIALRNPRFDGWRTANTCQSLILRIYNRAIDAEATERNPAKMKRIFSNDVEKRVGKLNADRFGAIWRELEVNARLGVRSDRAIQLYILTLQRPRDVVRAQAGDFDVKEGNWRIPKARTKTGKVYNIPLSPQAQELVEEILASAEGEALFPGRGARARLSSAALSHRFIRMTKRLVREGKLDSDDIQLYDFRRFGRTQLTKKLGVTLQVAEMVINHAPDRRMATLYDVGDYSEDVRQAQVAWGTEVLKMAYGSCRPDEEAA